jgi:hypothetical protein
MLTAELVCRRWREVATDHSKVLWRPVFESSPFSRWWLPYRPSHDFATLKGTVPLPREQLALSLRVHALQCRTRPNTVHAR